MPEVTLELNDLGGNQEESAERIAGSGLEEELQEVLITRPSLAAGRSFRRRSARTPFTREQPRYSSLPQSARRRPHSTPDTGRLEERRSSSFPDLTDTGLWTDVVLQDIEEEAPLGGGYDFSSELRHSTRRLRERIEEQ